MQTEIHYHCQQIKQGVKNMTDKAWQLCKELAQEVGKARGISDKEIEARFAVMQAQDFYNLYNIVRQPERYNATAVCMAMEEELRK